MADKKYGAVKGYRWSPLDMVYIQLLIQRLSLASGEQFGQVDVLRAALKVAFAMKDEDLLKAFREMRQETVVLKNATQEKRIMQIQKGPNMNARIEGNDYLAYLEDVVMLDEEKGIAFDKKTGDVIYVKHDHSVVVSNS